MQEKRESGAIRLFSKNQELTLTVTELNVFGFGVAKSDGAVFFVQNALPGETCLCRIIKCARNYYVARVVEFESKSPYRVEPECPVCRRCGGCVFQHASYELEKETKRRFILDCFHKAGLADVTVLPVLSVGETRHYRNKAQYPVSAEDGVLKAGFYAPYSHKVIPASDCLIQDASFSPIVEEVLSFCRETGVPAYEEETGNGLLRHIYLRIGKKTGQIMLCLILTRDAFPEEKAFVNRIKKRFPQIFSIAFNVNPKNTNVILGDKTRIVWGAETISDTLCDRSFSLSPASFYQVNHDGAELLYRTAFSMAGIDENTVLADLYCGVGTIAQCAAGKDQEIYGVEIVPQAVANARANAIKNGFTNAHYVCGDAASFFESIPPEKAGDALLILDPPRKGLSRDLIEKIVSSDFARILYISCNPETLARDVALLRSGGFFPGPVQPMDLFPRTGHVESVVLITRCG